MTLCSIITPFSPAEWLFVVISLRSVGRRSNWMQEMASNAANLVVDEMFPDGSSSFMDVDDVSNLTYKKTLSPRVTEIALCATELF